MRKTSMIAALVVLGGMFSGCSSYSGARPVPFEKVEIVLKENDFKVAQTNLKGKAQCQYIFGIAMGNPQVLSQAEQQLLQSASTNDKPIVLVNWTKDEVVKNFIIFKTHSMTLTADAIEFTR